MRDWGLTRWLIVLGIFVILLLGAALLYVLLQPDVFVPTPTEPEVEVPLEGLPPEVTGPPTFPPSPVEQIPLDQVQGLDVIPEIDIAAQGGLTVTNDLVIDPVQHVTINPGRNGVNYYDPATSRFYRINSEGVITSISDQRFAEVESVAWAPNSSDAVLEFPDGSNIVYNLDTGEQVTLPSHWQDFDFSPDSNNLAFKSLALDPDQNWLAVASKSGGSARAIAELGNNEDIVNVDWSPNNQVVATYQEPSGLTTSEVFFVGFNNENFPLSKVHGLNFEGTWSPTGRQILYSASHQDDDFRPRLWLVDGSGSNLGQNRRSTELNTWSYKCTYSGETTVYCGVPTALPRGAGIIPSVADGIADTIYEIDLQTGQTSQLAIPTQDLNVQDISTNEDGSELYIHDRFTGGLVRIDVAQ